VRLRGLRFRPKDETQVSAEALRIVDVCWSGAVGLAMTDMLRGAYFSTLQLQLALRCGERQRVARTLGLEATFISCGGVPAARRTQRILTLLRRHLSQTSSPYAEAWLTTSEGFSAFQLADFPRAHAGFVKAEKLFRDHCRLASHEVSSTQLFTLWTLFWRGELGELRTRVPVLLLDAEQRGDRYTATNLRTGTPSAGWLVDDTPDLAEQHIERAQSEWTPGGDAAPELSPSVWRNTRRLLWTVQIIRIEATHLQARLQLRYGKGTERAQALTAAIRQLRRERTPLAAAFAGVTEAAIARAQGADDRAGGLLAQAATLFEGLEMAAFSAAAHWHHGRITGGDEGRLEVAKAESYAARQGIRSWDRFAMMLLPGMADDRA